MVASEEFYEVPFEVEPNYAGWRLDLYLCEKIARLSRTAIKTLILEKLKSDRPLRPSTLVYPGLKFALLKPVLAEPPTTDLPAVLRYEDGEIVAIDKPAGLPMHPTARYYANTLVARLRVMTPAGEKWDPAHRLDRETSGLVLCGRSVEATTALKAMFAKGTIHKTYLAIVEGDPDFETTTIDAPLAEGTDVVRIGMRIDAKDGKEAVTDVVVQQRLRGRDGTAFALVACHPRTGRQHQIRAHLSHIGLPLVGDKIYGGDEETFVRFTEHRLTDEDRARLRLERHALHAAAVAFKHPMTGEALSLECPLPADLTDFLATLKPLKPAKVAKVAKPEKVAPEPEQEPAPATAPKQPRAKAAVKAIKLKKVKPHQQAVRRSKSKASVRAAEVAKARASGKFKYRPKGS
jgi:23S rRNA pseudouridine1911/1915/1917 synthase